MCELGDCGFDVATADVVLETMIALSDKSRSLNNGALTFVLLSDIFEAFTFFLFSVLNILFKN